VLPCFFIHRKPLLDHAEITCGPCLIAFLEQLAEHRSPTILSKLLNRPIYELAAIDLAGEAIEKPGSLRAQRKVAALVAALRPARS